MSQALPHTHRTAVQAWLPASICASDIHCALVHFAIALCFVAANARASDPTVAGNRHHVEISGFAFVPAHLQVSAGDSVTWINKDIVPHTIQPAGGLEPLSSELFTGDTFTLIVREPMRYVCGLHLSMQGQLAIEIN
ncbi:MAG: hypothetical protein V3U76_03000 [Granulosicoccus sp.]